MNTQTPFGGTPHPIISPGLRRAKIHSLSHQRVTIALDGSGSMQDENKVAHASTAMLELVKELALPCNKDGFEVAIIRFSHQAEIIHPFENASSLVGHLKPLEVDPTGEGTNITAAIELTNTILSEAAAQPSSPLVRQVRPFSVILSDGLHLAKVSPIPAANKLKQIADILTVAFGTDADEKMLQMIATEQLAIRCLSGADLRIYFAQIGQTLTVTRASGLSARALLANPQP